MNWAAVRDCALGVLVYNQKLVSHLLSTVTTLTTTVVWGLLS